MEKKNESAWMRFLGFVLFGVCLFASLLLFKIDERSGLIKVIRPRKRYFSYGDENGSWKLSFDIVTAYQVIVVDDDGVEKEYTIAPALLSFIDVGKHIHFNCRMNKIIRVFAQNEQTENERFKTVAA